MTIGSFPDWPATKAREQARNLRRLIDAGRDPLAERQEQRDALTVNALVDRFDAEHIAVRLRPHTARDYRAMLRLHIRPAIGRLKVASVAFEDIARMHSGVARSAPYAANRVRSVCSKMFSLAAQWKLRADNPCRGVERSAEHRREVFLSPTQIAKLGEVLAAHPERASAQAVQLLALTGARRSEVLGARWDEFDLEAGVWLKPHSNTKQKRDHRLPLSAPALQILAEMRDDADAADRLTPSAFLFPGRRGRPLLSVKRFWTSVASKSGLHGVRLHDLRHTHASILASQGFSLPLIGALLGHTQPATTARYAHLMDDALRAATERVGAVIMGGSEAEVVSLPARRGRRG